MTYEIGNIVKIREDLVCDNGKTQYEMIGRNFRDEFLPEMRRYCGDFATIKSATMHGYRLDIDKEEHNWTDEMFKDGLVGEYKPNDEIYCKPIGFEITSENTDIVITVNKDETYIQDFDTKDLHLLKPMLELAIEKANVL